MEGYRVDVVLCSVVLGPPTAISPIPNERPRGDLRLFADAVAEYERLLVAYSALGYEIAVLPKVSVMARADIILHMLEK